MRSLEEIRRTDPKWASILERTVEEIASILLAQRIGGLSGKMEVLFNHSATVLKAEVKPTRVIA